MALFTDVMRWFSGGDTQYHNLRHCMHGDTFWIVVTVTLDIAVALGYVLIAYHWYRNERTLPASPARSALRTMRNIFAFCGFCGYLFIPIKLYWPAWRLYDFFMLGLVFYTWRYALSSKNLKVIYTAVGRSRQLEADLAKSIEESKRKSLFFNAISHDLRTPLNGLLLHTNLAELNLDSNDPAAVRESLRQITESARLTSSLLDGLLDYARMETAGDKVVNDDFDLDELVGNVLYTSSAAAEAKGLKLTLRARTKLTLHTDRRMVERVLNNLIENAVKFTASGSVRVDIESARSNVEIHVVDTGIGIAAEHHRRLFEEFYQVQNAERDRDKGSGLGLAISRRLAEQLGGELRVESAVGSGSRFSLILPDAVTGRRNSVGIAHPETARTAAAQPAASVAGGR